jgi:predicted nucleic acid-binding protein
MIVVADTSPINYLILIDQIGILEVLYGRILIPHAVHEEMLSLKAPSSVRAWSKNPPHWLEILSPSTTLNSPVARLDRGETEAIALAEELNADWLLIDEAAGRDEATKRGLQTIGTLGILREGHRAGLLNLRTAIAQLSATGFRVNQSLVQLLLDSV